MLVLRTKKDGEYIRRFQNYGELFRHITHQEKEKLKPGGSLIDPQKPHWSFQVISPNRAAEIVNILGKNYDTALLYEAWRMQVPVVELCEGNYRNPHLVLLTPNISMDALKEDWCEDHCHAHGISIT